MFANISGIWAAQIFRADDRPRYHRALTINVCIIAFALSLASALALYLKFRYKRNKVEEDSREENTESGIRTPDTKLSDDDE